MDLLCDLLQSVPAVESHWANTNTKQVRETVRERERDIHRHKQKEKEKLPKPKKSCYPFLWRNCLAGWLAGWLTGSSFFSTSLISQGA